LLIEAGVQNTISSLMRYLVIITALIVGFSSSGLGDLVWYLVGALILGLGWVIKDPIGDLVAYFIIILQQPIKVGDLIWIDEIANGVVRRITPRSVEIRRKNSATLIIPNTYVTARVVTNWHFVRGYVAFDDILLTVAFKHDPSKVREILLRVLDESRLLLKNPRPIVRLESFSDLGYVFLVRGFLSSHYTLDMWDIASEVRLSIVKRLREHGIELASGVRLVSTHHDRVHADKVDPST
jgi:potassium efflux system protein